MNAIMQTDLSAATLEKVVGTGNLADLNPRQRVEYMVTTCRSRGLNPLTRPFRFMSFQGQVVMYATRDCADQLRKIDGVNIEIAKRETDGELYIVEVRATDRTGRADADLGVVTIGGLKGEARANAILKAITKAKRRVTLSICGLGILDESEVADMAGARPLPDDVIEGQAEATPETAPEAPPPKRTLREVVRDKLAAATSMTDVLAVADMPAVHRALAEAPDAVKQELKDLLADAFAKFQEAPAENADAGPDDLEIEGEQYAAA